MQNEPVMTGAAVLSFIAAACTLLVVFGVPISDDQVAAIIKFVGAGLTCAPIVLGWFVRGNVWSAATHAAEVAKALATPAPGQPVNVTVSGTTDPKALAAAVQQSITETQRKAP